MSAMWFLHADGAAFESERAAIQLGQGLRAQRPVRLATIGRGGMWRNALAAARGLRQGRPELIHAFDARSLLAAALGTRAALVFTPPVEGFDASVRLIRAISEYRPVHVVCPSGTLHRRAVERGVPIERCHLIRPGVDFSRLKRRRDPDLRARLGLGSDDIVVLAPGESTRAADHARAAWAVSILRVTQPRFRLLMWGRGEDVARVERLAHQLERRHWIVNARRQLGPDTEFEQILPAADLVLAPARRPVATLPLAICMAAQLPIVASATYTHSELLEDRHTALLVPDAAPRLLARRVLDLRDNADLAWRIADMARVEAYEYHAQTRYLDQHRALYDAILAGRAIELAPAPAGAGLRFHGRG